VFIAEEVEIPDASPQDPDASRSIYKAFPSSTSIFVFFNFEKFEAGSGWLDTRL
jgi:hypothetical protein